MNTLSCAMKSRRLLQQTLCSCLRSGFLSADRVNEPAANFTHSFSSKMNVGDKSPAVTPTGQGVTPTGQGSPSSATRINPSTWFVTEIQQMMYGFGDCKKPLLESAALIEDIVHQEMTQLLYQAAEVAGQRNARFLGIEDFLYLLRKQKVKLRRLIRYMELKDMKSAAMKGIDEEETSESGEGKAQPKKRRKLCYDFLNAIDQTGELIALFDDDSVDEIKQQRALRAELQTRHMDRQQYLEYCEARQTHFSRKYKSQRFKDWVMQGVILDIKPNPLAMDVLSYMAYETVAQVVDLALLVKRDMRAAVDDPFSQAMPPVCHNYELPDVVTSAQPTASQNTTSLMSPNALTSPNKSPPSTPTSSTSQTTISGNTSSMAAPPTSQSSGGSGGSAKSKAKKRKKSGSVTSLEAPPTQAIQPGDILEAMRRYAFPGGPFEAFSRNPNINFRQRLLCA